jgi:glutamate dehydrogenase/leucine dehydrogenase
VQGLGNVGYWFAKLAQDMGFVIVALSDSKGGILADDQTKGLDVAAVLKYKKDHKTVAGFAGTKSITQEELLSLPVEVLVPAALENVITGENARTIQAKVVVEMANGPVTPDADAVLWERGILSVPDVLSNAGGVTVSYFEWVQNLHGYSWKHAEVLAKLQPIMEAAFARMWELHESKKVPLRKAAYLVAVKRVVDAMILRGAV